MHGLGLTSEIQPVAPGGGLPRIDLPASGPCKLHSLPWAYAMVPAGRKLVQITKSTDAWKPGMSATH